MLRLTTLPAPMTDPCPMRTPSRRADFGRFSEPIDIEDKVWIGSNAVIL
ncbi:hypothetical protein ACFQ6U_28340 [Streptomyces sp. NPDC056465]